MPISYRIDSDLGVVLTTATGALTDDELLAHKKKLARDPAFTPGMAELADMRGVERIDVTAEGVRTLIAQDQAAGVQGSLRLAIVASQDELFGMARMYQMLGEDGFVRVHVCRDADDARAWLGLPREA